VEFGAGGSQLIVPPPLLGHVWSGVCMCDAASLVSGLLARILCGGEWNFGPG
jgi:hypothetical protein